MVRCCFQLSREEATQKTGQTTFVNRFSQELDTLLVSPRVVNKRLTFEFAQIHVGIVNVHGLRDMFPLFGSELWISDELVFARMLQHWIEGATLPVDEIPGPYDMSLEFPAGYGFQVNQVIYAVEKAQRPTG